MILSDSEALDLCDAVKSGDEPVGRPLKAMAATLEHLIERRDFLVQLAELGEIEAVISALRAEGRRAKEMALELKRGAA